jgi:hypothetical protein
VKRSRPERGIVADATTCIERPVTDPSLSTAPATLEASEPPVPARIPAPALQLLTSHDDVVCVDDLCLPAGTRQLLDAADDEPPVDGTERAR